ncbi:MAG: DUF3313 family protein [Halieaceae bacterium]
MYTKIITAAATALFLTACAGEPEIQTGDDAEVIMGNLHKVDNSRVQMAYLDPDANLGKYNRVLVRPLGVDKIEIIQPSRTTSVAGNKDWELTESDKTELQTMFHEVMVKQLQEKGGYEVVDEPGDDVLEIAAMITAIAPSAAKDDNQSRAVGRTRVYTEGAGSIAVAVAYGDSETGEVLGLAKDSRSSNSYWGSNNSVSNKADVRRMFTSWAIGIREGLDRVHGKK